MKMNEIWKDIKNYEGIFQVSNLGRVKSLPREIFKSDGKVMKIKGKIRKLHETEDGYFRVRLVYNNTGKSFLVHRLVASAFIPNPDNKTDVNHKDENKQNNEATNLEWSTHKENCDHSSWYYENMKKSNYVKVMVIKDSGEELNFDSILEMSKTLEVAIPTAHTYVQNSRVLSRGRFKGWYFGYKKDN